MNHSIHNVFKIHLNKANELEEHLVAKYMVQDGVFYILEDHASVFHDLKSRVPVDDKVLKELALIHHNPYYKVVDLDSKEHFLNSLPVTTMEKFLELHNTYKDEQTKLIPITYKYTKGNNGMIVTYQHNKFFKDGQEIPSGDIQLMISAVQNGLATLEVVPNV